MQVREFFEMEKISKDLLVEHFSEFSEYWSNATDFVIDNWNKQIESLTEKQACWLTRIQEDVAELAAKEGWI